MTRSVESHEAKWVTKVAAPCQARDATTFRVIAPIIGSGSVAADARAQREATAACRLRQEGRARGLHLLHHTFVERIERAPVALQVRRHVAEADDRKLDVAEPLEVGRGIHELGQMLGESQMALDQ